MRQYVFVGERPSPKAHAMGATWRSGGLCAKSLHDALRAADVDPASCEYINLWDAPGIGEPEGEPNPFAVAGVRELAYDRWRVIALGKRVHRELSARGINARYAVHPAARGTIRLKSNYAAHIREALFGAPSLPEHPET